MTPTIRLETAEDHEAIRHVNRLAFGRDDEAGIVDALRNGGYARVSLVAEVNGVVVGHILFSDLPILTDNGPVSALSLAPMAVLSTFQKQGIGSALVQKGLEVCREQGHRIIIVLGHSHFYPRFGFSAKLAEPLSSPFWASDSWMALELVRGALDGIRGWVRYPPPFGMGVQVRPVYRPDQAEWVRMRIALWPDEGKNEQAEEVTAFFTTDTFLWSESLLSWKVFVAERPAGGLCGFVEASIRPYVAGCVTCPVGYIEGWYVDPDMRRRRIGRKLVEAVERWATDQGCKEVASDAHLWNTVSHESHKALGFEEAERLVHFRKRLKDSPEEKGNCAFASPRLKLLAVAGSFTVCKLPISSPIPPWTMMGDLFSVTRTADGLSVVCRQEVVPEGIVCERGWRCLRAEGSMPFTLVGVLASLTAPIANAGVGIFAFSTFDTDYLLIKASDMPKAVAALRAAGHLVDAEGIVYMEIESSNESRLQPVRVTVEQVDLVAPLFDAYRQFYGQTPDLGGARRFLAERLRRGESVILAIVEDGRALGFMQLYPSFSSVSMKPIWILNDLFVSEQARRRGVGARLLRAAREHALRTGAARLALSTAVTNTNAQALYERDGWRRDTQFLHYEFELPKEGG